MKKLSYVFVSIIICLSSGSAFAQQDGNMEIVFKKSSKSTESSGVCKVYLKNAEALTLIDTLVCGLSGAGELYTNLPEKDYTEVNYKAVPPFPCKVLKQFATMDHSERAYFNYTKYYIIKTESLIKVFKEDWMSDAEKPNETGTIIYEVK